MIITKREKKRKSKHTKKILQWKKPTIFIEIYQSKKCAFKILAIQKQTHYNFTLIINTKKKRTNYFKSKQYQPSKLIKKQISNPHENPLNKIP